jgi:hypothetical protein
MFFPDKQTLATANESTAFLLLSWEELFSNETPDSYQPKILNVTALIEELEQIATRAGRHKKWERHVKKIQEELKAACEADQSVLFRSPRLQWGLQSLVATNNLAEIPTIIKVINFAISEYEALTIDAFCEAVADLPKAKHNTAEALRRLSTIAIRNGFSKADFRHLFVNENFKKAPVEIGKAIVDSIIPINKQYTCIIAVKGEVKNLQIVGRTAGFSILAESHLTAYANGAEFSQKTKGCVHLSIQVETANRMKAIQTAIRKIRPAIDIFNLYRFDALFLSDDTLIIEKEKQPTLFNLQQKWHWQSTLRKNTTRNAKSLINECEGKKERFNSVLNALEHYSLSQVNAASRVRLVNLWSALECLTTSDDKDSIIGAVCDAVVPLVVWRRTAKILSYTSRNLLTLRELTGTSLGVGFPPDEGGLSNERLILALSKPENHPSPEELQIFSRQHPLLGFRIFSLWKLFSNPQDLAEELKSSARRAEWHLYRIYRARNLIVHEGTEVTHANLLLGNLHYYFRVTASRILHGMRLNPDWDVKDSVEYWKMRYNFIIDDLEKNQGKSLEVFDFFPNIKPDFNKVKIWG